MKYIILNIAEDKTITWEKIETTEASGNILVLINGDGETEATLPDIEFASTNFIYCLLTPEYQRGLNIGLTNDNSANKNFYEEWIVIETETEKKAKELVSKEPQKVKVLKKQFYIINIVNSQMSYLQFHFI